jgi:hypothetical protein
MAMFYIVTLLKALFGMVGLILQGESLDSSLGWLDPVTATLECCSLPEGVAVEDPRRPRGVMRWSVQIYGHCYSLPIVDLIALGHFFFFLAYA